MKAFHNDIKIKAKYVNRVMAHAKADRLTQGIGWRNGKGCAVGCTLENYDHKQYETELGIPEWLARLEDGLFEGMEKKYAMKWPSAFLKAIPVGANLARVRKQYVIYLIKENINILESLLTGAKEFKNVARAIHASRAVNIKMIKALRKGKVPAAISASALRAKNNAMSAGSFTFDSSARAAADAAVWAAAVATPADRFPEYTSYCSAVVSAYAASSITYAGIGNGSEQARKAAEAAYSAAHKAANLKHARKLIELLKECK